MERRILELFAARYPASAQRRGGRPLRLKDWRLLIPEAFQSADARLTFLDVMERLESAGILRLFWAKRRVGDELVAAELADSRALFRRLGYPVPEDQAESLAVAADALAAAAEKRGSRSCAAFFRFLSSKADSLGGRIGPRDLEDAAALFALDYAEVDRLPIRALSINLFRDSKRLESLVSVLRPLLARVAAEHPEAAGIALPERMYPEAAIAGDVDLEFVDGRIWTISFRPIVLSLSAAAELRSVRPRSANGALRPPRALSVENKETFHAFACAPEGFDFLVCSAGHPNRAVRAVLGALVSGGFDVFHAGDLDADGIAILGEVWELSGATPFGMDRDTFDRYLPCARDLDAALVARLAGVPDAALALPGIRELAQRIRETRRGVEQEIVDYASCRVP